MVPNTVSAKLVDCDTTAFEVPSAVRTGPSKVIPNFMVPTTAEIVTNGLIFEPVPGVLAQVN